MMIQMEVVMTTKIHMILDLQLHLGHHGSLGKHQFKKKISSSKRIKPTVHQALLSYQVGDSGCIYLR